MGGDLEESCAATPAKRPFPISERDRALQPSLGTSSKQDHQGSSPLALLPGRAKGNGILLLVSRFRQEVLGRLGPADIGSSAGHCSRRLIGWPLPASSLLF